MMSILFSHFEEELPALFSYAIGFIYSLLAGLQIWRTHQSLYTKFDGTGTIGWRAIITGLVERCLYTGSALMGRPEFVAVWIVMKSVAHWERFRSDAKHDNRNLDATAKFNGYFINNGLSIAYGMTGAYVTKLLLCEKCITAIIFMISLSASHALLNMYVSCQSQKESSSCNQKYSHKNQALIGKKKK
jgi:hypothetical protein